MSDLNSLNVAGTMLDGAIAHMRAEAKNKCLHSDTRVVFEFVIRDLRSAKKRLERQRKAVRGSGKKLRLIAGGSK